MAQNISESMRFVQVSIQMSCSRLLLRAAGVIETPMLGEIDPNDTTNIAEMTKDMAMGRRGRPEEVAEALLWLSSPNASFVTGIALPVNGGDAIVPSCCHFG